MFVILHATIMKVKVIQFMSILLFLDKSSLVQIKHKTTAADI